MRIFYSLSLAMLVDSMGLNVILPLMPALFFGSTSGFQLADTQWILYLYGITLGIYPLAKFFGMAFFGVLADRTENKVLLLLAATGNILGYCVCAFAIIEHNLILFLCSRFCNGFLSGAQSLSKALITSLSGTGVTDRLMSLRPMSLAARLGGIIGPSLAIFAVATTYIKNEFVPPILIVLLFSIINFFFLSNSLKGNVTSSPIKPSHPIKLSDFFRITYILFQRKSTRLIALSFFVYQIATALFSQGLSLYLKTKLDYSTTQIGTFMLSMSIILAASLYFIKYFSKHMYYAHLLKLILFLNAGIFFYGFIVNRFNVYVFRNPSIHDWIISGIFFFTLALTQLLFTTLFSEKVASEEQGLAMGAMGQITAIGQLLPSLFVGHIIMHHLILLLSGITFLIAFLLLHASTNTTQTTTSQKAI